MQLEPGRSLVAGAGLLLTRLIRTKRCRQAHLAIVDAGMNDFLRPALYGARHPIRLLHPTTALQCSQSYSYTVVGPVCESADVFGTDIVFPRALRPRDTLAILGAGAYGAAMASTYNARPLPREVSPFLFSLPSSRTLSNSLLLQIYSEDPVFLEQYPWEYE